MTRLISSSPHPSHIISQTPSQPRIFSSSAIPKANEVPATLHVNANANSTNNNSMNSHDLSDERNEPSFPSLSSSFHMSASLGMYVPLPSSSPCNGTGWNGDHIPTLERDFCSDFTCCGQSLGDLHELIDHFEEAHVTVIGPDGSSVYPTSQTGLGDRTPTPYCAVTPFSKVVFEDHRSWISEAVSDSSRLLPAKLTVPETEALVADFDVISETWTNLSADQLCLPPSSFTVDTDVDVQHDGHSSCLPLRTEKKRQRGNVGSRRRDKSHKCPRPGCTKSYLNPNGLKYHLEKGTCSIDPTFHRDPLRANCKDPFLMPE